VLVLGADGVGFNSLMCFYGHTGTYGCRFCVSKGEHRVDGEVDENGEVQRGKSGMYFQSRNALLRTYESLILKDQVAPYVSI